MIRRILSWLVLGLLSCTLMSCFEITNIDQPKSAKAGDKITARVEVKTNGVDQNPHHGIVAIRVPSAWNIISVKMKGDYGRDTLKPLPADTPDGDRGGVVDYWQPELERKWDPGTSEKWIVFQTSKGYKAVKEIAFVDITIEMQVGNTPGVTKLGYFVTNAALDFSDPSFYSVSLENPIEIK